MTTFQYDRPYGTPGERPRCWGDERIRDVQTRECRTCPFENSCGDQVTRARNARNLASHTVQNQPVQPPMQGYGSAYFAQFAPPQVANPLPILQQPFQQPQQQRPFVQNPVPVQPVMAPRPAPAPLPVPPQADRYGWIQDPLYLHIAACPPPPRPQFEGEGFAMRMGKNIFLDMVESFFKQCLLGVRQMVLPPTQTMRSQDDRSGE